MKSILLSLILLVGTSTLANARGYVPPMGSLIPTFHYLNSDKAKLVNKKVKDKKVLKNAVRREINRPTETRFYRTPVGSGKASYYWQGQRTANGEAFKPDGISCAHKTLPFNTRIRVTNLNNGKSVVCRVNDRGPFIAGRVVDLSRGAARVVNMTGAGVVPVRLEVL